MEHLRSRGSQGGWQNSNESERKLHLDRCEEICTLCVDIETTEEYLMVKEQKPDNSCCLDSYISFKVLKPVYI